MNLFLRQFSSVQKYDFIELEALQHYVTIEMI